ncbi:hypothetical protein SAMN04490220_0685 [Rhodococcus jostii]|uniref:Uncharacterized protein n=1 Tax=Rhodococcus jostii TaxID=132919 RepID=A0A1H4J761_RHOJO|nr:hypothetical protein SAMN04490220_0685 [Rhodococcus jostii]
MTAHPRPTCRTTTDRHHPRRTAPRPRAHLGRSVHPHPDRPPPTHRPCRSPHLDPRLPPTPPHQRIREPLAFRPRHAPSSAPQLDDLTTNHARVHRAANAVERTASTYRHIGTLAARDDLRGAIERLCTVLLPQLDREERHASLAADTLTPHEWATWLHHHPLGTTSPTELTRETNWLTDTLDPVDANTSRTDFAHADDPFGPSRSGASTATEPDCCGHQRLREHHGSGRSSESRLTTFDPIRPGQSSHSPARPLRASHPHQLFTPATRER